MLFKLKHEHCTAMVDLGTDDLSDGQMGSLAVKEFRNASTVLEKNCISTGPCTHGQEGERLERIAVSSTVCISFGCWMVVDFAGREDK